MEKGSIAYMLTQDQLAAKIAAKQKAIATGIVGLQQTINGYDFNPRNPVKLKDHTALARIITQAQALDVLVNELGTLRNVNKSGKAKRASAVGSSRARRSRGF